MAISSSGAVTSTGAIGGSNATTLATTGSNTFTGQQYVSNTNAPVNFTDTASLYTDGGLRVGKDAYVSGTLYLNDLTVYGTQSVNYITSSQLDIADNIITVNTSTPAIRFGGIAVRDSGSLGTGLTGSLLWDSQNNHWVYTNPSGSSYSGGMMISGPRASSLGEEQGTTFNALMKGQGGDHITSSGVFESGSNVGIGTSTPTAKLDVQGTGRFTDALTGSSATFSDNVGIGISPADYPLHILKSTSATTSEFIRLRNGFNDPSTGIRIGWGFASLNGAYLDVTTDSGGTKSMTIYLSAANATPSQVFNIAGTGAATFSGQIKTTFAGQSISINAASTDSVRMQLQNNNVGNSIVAVESSAGGSQFTGTTAYSMAIGTATARDLFLGTNSVQRFKLDGTTGAATFASSATAGTFLGVTRAGANDVGSGPYVVIAQPTSAIQWLMQLNASAGLDYWHYNGSAWSIPLRLASSGAATFASSVTTTKANTFTGTVSAANNTATIMQQCSADGGNGSIYLIVAAIGGAGTNRIAMGILVTISQGGGTARWAFQNDGGDMFLTDPGSNGIIYVRHTVGGTQTINYSILRIG
jgi:hypothetical protein